MNRIVCYPRTSTPSNFENGVEYFELFSRSESSGSNNKSLGISLAQKLREYKIIPTVQTIDFAAFAFSVVASDKLVTRSNSPDGWTRMIDLTIYIVESVKWMKIKEKIEKMLRFLTGDYWSLTFLPATAPMISLKHEQLRRENDCVCLLSGGVDSLAGAIDLIADNRKPLFVSQIIRGDGERQRVLANRLGDHNQCQWSIGKLYGNEGSTRARSIAFFAFALLASSSISKPNEIAEIIVPENGFISLNIPLDTNRIGSLSTKTTHPIYMKMLQDIWNEVGIKAKLILPYKLKTKGEVLKECKNKQLLEELVFETNSCGKFQRHGLRHCGVCVPCLVRRAAFLEAKLHDTTRKGYRYEDIRIANSKDVAAVALAVKQVEISGINRLIKGNLSFADTLERTEYAELVSRGINELKNLLEGHGVL